MARAIGGGRMMPNRRLAIGATIAALLMVPLIAMRVTDKVRWTAFDFAVATVLLAGAGIGCELAVRSLQGRRRAAATGAVLIVLLLVWAQGAVGIR